jgi:hypothetical protein
LVATQPPGPFTRSVNPVDTKSTGSGLSEILCERS